MVIADVIPIYLHFCIIYRNRVEIGLILLEIQLIENGKYYGDNMLVNHKKLLAVTVSC